MAVYIIAEAGVNHNGSFELAKRMVEVAAKAGADAVKFQTFIPEKVMSRYAEKADYQKTNTGNDESQLDMVRKLFLPYEDFLKLREHCQSLGITFLSTPFDLESLEFLGSMKLPYIKIPSGEITNLPLLIAAGRQKTPVILSTGMCDMEDVRYGRQVLLDNGCPEVTLLHCNTQYPTPFEDANLLAMLALKKEFGGRVGYSDHTLGIEAPIAAAALGAEVIEKHFTLDKAMEGPDHVASLDPGELEAMVRAVRNIEKALGSGRKERSRSETPTMPIARKSIVAARDIKAGETFTEQNITVKRPGNGVSPKLWFQVLGTAAKRDFKEDELIEL